MSFYFQNPAVVHELGRHRVEDLIFVAKTNVSLMFLGLVHTTHGHILLDRRARSEVNGFSRMINIFLRHDPVCGPWEALGFPYTWTRGMVVGHPDPQPGETGGDQQALLRPVDRCHRAVQVGVNQDQF